MGASRRASGPFNDAISNVCPLVSAPRRDETSYLYVEALVKEANQIGLSLPK